MDHHYLPPALRQLKKGLSRLGGVGEKTALRYALNILNWSHRDQHELVSVLQDLKNLKHCGMCQFYSEDILCEICKNPRRQNSGILCVVEGVQDLMAIEGGQHFQGTYFVLKGVLNPLLGIGPEEIGIPLLIKTILSLKVHTVILAIGPHVEGEATCSYIKEILAEKENLQIVRIGFGIPIGSSLQYLDSLTISKGFENARNF